MLGFGFNKAKILSSAEKYVQQGKLQNAIAEYQKIVKNDPRDLTVLNTIGDLYARVGNPSQAATYFRQVAEAYAGEGFTVKAIAMYKKLTKVDPSESDCVLKLAELYTQQGLYNDARSQYVQVADQLIRSGKLEQAAQIFQKMLEFDPENATMQGKLADVCMRLGKKEEAREIFFRSAESLYQRGSMEGAAESLKRVLTLDPAYSPALLLRGKIALDTGDAAVAVECFNKVPDIDSRIDGLRGLLRAHTLLGHSEELEALAKKMLAVHNDIGGFSSYAEALMGRGDFEPAFKIYLSYADRLLSVNPTAVLNSLHTAIARVKENAACLELLRQFFRKSGDSTHVAEVSELLAHAYVQQGRLVEARDLYKHLTQLEPENPLHLQSYRQIVSKIGGDAATRPLSVEQGSQPLMAEEMEAPPALPQGSYPGELAEAIKAALTEAELYDSYKVPAKAIAPLEAVLPRAPRDIALNQQLASLYARAGRFAEAARCCSLLKSAYAELGQEGEARRFADLAKKHLEHAGVPPQAGVDDTLVLPPKAQAAPPFAREIDLSSEWESAAKKIPPVVTSFDELPMAGDESEAEGAAQPTSAEFVTTSATAIVAEIEFYLSNSMWDEARAAIAKCEALAPDLDRLTEFRAQLPGEAAAGAPAEPPAEMAVEAAAPAVTEFAFETPAAQGAAVEPLTTAEIPAAEVAAIRPGAEAPAMGFVVEVGAQTEPEPTVTEFQFESTGEAVEAESMEPEAAVEELAEATHDFFFEEAQAAAAEPEGEPAPLMAAAEAEFAPVASLAAEPVSTPPELVDLAEPEPAPVEAAAEAMPPAPPAPMAEMAAAPVTEIAPEAEKDLLGSFVLDLEESLGDDFAPAPSQAAPASATPPVVPVAPAAAVPASAAPAPVPAAGAAAAAAAASAAPPAPTASAAHFAIPVVPPAAPVVSEQASALSDLFEEFKEDVEQGTPEAEDPETHYNLGVAFKEMGLLDEAIGELQKVCQAIDQGQRFPRVIEAYTWLAQCFVEKGVPEAAVRWYEKALKLPNLDSESSTALYYELACAHEAGGNRQAALANFMEVYGVNIDYRDVSERIKALKS